jgi:hypothetical protein
VAIKLLPLAQQDYNILRAVTGLKLNPQHTNITALLAIEQRPGKTAQIAGAGILDVQGKYGRAWVHVLPVFRRQGLGSRLYHQLAKSAGHLMSELSPWKSTFDAEGSAFLAHHDFSLREQFDVYDAPREVAASHAEKHFRRLQKKGTLTGLNIYSRINEAVDVVDAQTLLGADFSAQYLRQFEKTALLGFAKDKWLLSLHEDKHLVGVAVGKFSEDSLWTDAYSICPAYRRGWAHLVIKYKVAEILTDAHQHISRFKFCTGDKHNDTRSYARRLQAQKIDTQTYYTKQFTQQRYPI